MSKLQEWKKKYSILSRVIGIVFIAGCFCVLAYIYKPILTRIVLLSLMIVMEITYWHATGKPGTKNKILLFVASFLSVFGFLADYELESNIYTIVTDNGVQFTTEVGKAVFYIVFLILCIYFCSIGVMHVLEKLRFEAFFLASLITMVLVYLLLSTPNAFYDPEAHISETYRYSNIFMGYETGDLWSGRECDVDYIEPLWSQFTTNVSNLAWTEKYMYVQDNGQVKAFSTQNYQMNFYSIINYFPQVLGLTLGRLMRFPAPLAFLLGRVMISIAYIAGGYRAIKKMPFAKTALAAVIMLPLSVSQGCSYSYDAVLYICAFNFIAGVFALTNDKDNNVLYVETIIWTFFLGAVKGGGYLLLLPLIIMLCAKDKKSILRVLGIAIAGVMAILLFDVIVPTGKLYQLQGAGDDRFSTAWGLAHPIASLKLVFNTYMGWSELPSKLFGIVQCSEIIPWFIPAAMTIILVTMQENVESSSVGMTKRNWIIVIITIFIALVMVPLAMLRDIQKTATMITTMSPRYLIPFLPVIFLLIVKNRKGVELSIEKTANKYFAVAILLLIQIYYMLMKTLTWL